MATLINAPIEWALAELAQPGQSESGDRHLVLSTPAGGLVAVVDGLGHGAEAASAAKVAVRALERGGDRPLVQLFRDCHQSLIGTRGAVISADALVLVVRYLGAA
jgi:negative regulator of sigma-B (phosphoserine phosphatase)